jgi:hypothetical protein
MVQCHRISGPPIVITSPFSRPGSRRDFLSMQQGPSLGCINVILELESSITLTHLSISQTVSFAGPDLDSGFNNDLVVGAALRPPISAIFS